MTEIVDGELFPLQGIRKVAARRMVEAWQSPVFHLTVEVNMTEALKVKQVVSDATVTDVITLATAKALLEHPDVNSHVTEEGIVKFSKANVGIAVATEKGLTVPVIHNVTSLSLSEIAAARKDIVSRAREGKLTRDDINGGTFSISNLGMMAITRFDAILNVPQSAILAIGATEMRQRYNDGNPSWEPMAEFTLTCDHRALDGATAAAFINTMRENIQAVVAG